MTATTTKAISGTTTAMTAAGRNDRTHASMASRLSTSVAATSPLRSPVA